MAPERHPYRAYLLRIWWAGHDGDAGWRASLAESHTGLRRGFATLEQLCTFLKEQTESTPPGDDTRASERS